MTAPAPEVTAEPVGFVMGWHVTVGDPHADVRLDVRLYSNKRHQFKTGDNIYAHPPVAEPVAWRVRKDDGTYAYGDGGGPLLADGEEWRCECLYLDPPVATHLQAQSEPQAAQQSTSKPVANPITLPPYNMPDGTTGEARKG